jgi:putative SOS response-associated peptidase YedK
MCGRYVISNSYSQLALRFALAEVSDVAWRGTYNASPGQQLPVLVLEGGKLSLKLMKWGLFPAWATQQAGTLPSINARCETLSDKPFFRTAFRQRRCLVPANGFYEWVMSSGKKSPHYIFQEENLFAFGGLWEPPATASSVPTFAIVTQAANNFVRPIHDRMPVMLTRNEEMDWMTSSKIDGAWFQSLHSAANTVGLCEHEVSAQLNSSKADGPSCVLPICSPRLPGF